MEVYFKEKGFPQAAERGKGASSRVHEAEQQGLVTPGGRGAGNEGGWVEPGWEGEGWGARLGLFSSGLCP